MRQKVESNRPGFTLIELVVVLMIIAAIAALIIPQVAMLGRTTDMAASAKTQADLNNNIQMHFVQLKRFPQGFDSLLVDAGGSGTPTGVLAPVGIDGATAATSDTDQYGGLPVNGAQSTNLANQLVLGTLTGQFRRSLTRTGMDWVYDHETDRGAYGGNNNDSALYQRALVDPIPVAEVYTNNNSSETLGAGYGGAQTNIAQILFPEGVPANTRLVAFGVGQRCSLVPKTMNQAPIYPGNDGRYYGHYVAIFQVFDTGERAVLVAVVDSYGRTTKYTIQQYNESLPDGARQG